MSFFGSIRPVEAIRAHQKIQKSRPKEYSSEITVSHTLETDKFLLDVNGRIDGVFEYPGRVIIDEIKTTTRELDFYEHNDNIFHWGQVKSYAYIYAAKHNLEVIETQLTYYNIETKESREIRRSFSIEELGDFFNSLVSAYLAWADTLAEWNLLRDKSINVLEFPFVSYRHGQREMAVGVYRAIKKEEQLIVQAPGGIGKTMAVLFPSVKALGENLTGKIFYLTARTTGKTVAEKALAELKDKGLRLKSLSLTAKEKICFRPGCACTADECEFARGHFDRIGQAIGDAFRNDTFTRGTVEEFARKHSVCPFEFSLDLSLWVDCIICDYNYAFDPRVYLRRFFQEGNGDYTFLIDEAHNLVDRARDMFSAELFKKPVLDLRRSVRKELPVVYKNLTSINTWMVKAGKLCEKGHNSRTEKGAPAGLYPYLRKFTAASERWLSRNIKTSFREKLLDVYFAVNGFLRVAEQFDESYASLYEKNDNDLRVKLFCINPAGQMKEALERSTSAVFFSATMTPADYFKRILGLDESADEIVLPSPYPAGNLRVLIAGSISTLYKHRDRTKNEVTAVLSALVNQKKGNYLMFFPSYRYMLKIYELFTEENPCINTILQTRDMTEEHRELFLERFAHDNEETLAGFAVMGGIFGEGIDFAGDRLTGAVIVGVGLPGISPEREIIRDYFNMHNGRGFEFAYLYPGINKVFQAAGRVIRSETDRGVVLLVGERFVALRYRALFPQEWNPDTVQDEGQINEALKIFWSE